MGTRRPLLRRAHAGAWPGAGLVTALATSLPGAGQAGPLSSFAVVSDEASAALMLFYVMLGAGVVLWLATLGIALYATRVQPGAHAARGVHLLLFGGGVAVPLVVLTALTVHGLSGRQPLELREPDLRIEIIGERWWWRVRYLDSGNDHVELANELRLPVGRHAGIALKTDEVIHSLWLPALGGKRDLLPGRVNHVGVTPNQAGVFRGTCAEYCGDGHANMGLVVQTMAPARFEQWLAGQRLHAQPPASVPAARGAALFQLRGCALCHTIRGTQARGTFGPDLTHVGSRHSIGAGLLPADAASFERWIAHTRGLKPAARMPPFALPRQELADLAHYLEQLR